MVLSTCRDVANPQTQTPIFPQYLLLLPNNPR